MIWISYFYNALHNFGELIPSAFYSPPLFSADYKNSCMHYVKKLFVIV